MSQAFTLSPTTIGIAFLLFFAGAAVAWFWSRVRARELSSRIRELEAEGSGRLSVEAELRRQSLEVKAERDVLREKFEQESQRRVSAETTALKARENLEEQKKLLDQARVQLSDAFSAIASEALGKSAAQFLDLANAKFESLRGEAVGDLDQRKVAIEGLVKPLGETLGNLNDRLSQVESSRQEAYGELRTQVLHLAETNKELRLEAGSLANTLKQPQVKGRWGELTLRRAVELAGMTSHCDFDEQQSVQTEDGGSQRPDMVVHLTGGRSIVVDAKVPLHAFLAAAAARDPEDREQALASHARLMRDHIQSLSRKEYWKQFQPTPDYVVLFVPGESFFSAALEKMPTLIEEASANHIMLASPTTLIALLYTVAYGWRQEMLAENAEKISALGKDLYDRLSVFAEYLGDVGRSLERANEAYTKSVRSFNSRLMPGANKFRELGVASTKDIEPLEPVESLPEPLAGARIEGEATPPAAQAARAASASGSDNT
ncbi:MAG TPA: DNA recombination protein RmuC [Candidatus Acidoferrales bacterium]|jgi:DNA recombination protein RmuC|nr:DNA recombination protein RmuC [Candidatus Acidoferrales bacterium]